MTKYFTKSEYEIITNLLHSDNYDNWYLAFDLIKTHPKYKNFKNLIVRTYYNDYVFYSSSRPGCIKRTFEREIKSWLKVIDWLRDEHIIGLGFTNLLGFIEKRTFKNEKKIKR